ncbi:hypothetical protein SUNI508_11669 [Seiridium unicorne]|uniref:Uncharacterized protein n=1 Tax=Seiridium unicorne TaxID=138068 RepID=A0ABR2UH95_9PEZI
MTVVLQSASDDGIAIRRTREEPELVRSKNFTMITSSPGANCLIPSFVADLAQGPAQIEPKTVCRLNQTFRNGHPKRHIGMPITSIWHSLHRPSFVTDDDPPVSGLPNRGVA